VQEKSRLSSKAGRDAVAVFDVGTNTVLYLLMARRDDGELVVLDEGFAPTRLGEGLARGEHSAEAVARTVEALASFVERVRRRGPAELKVVGTEVLRHGGWRKDFAAAVAIRLGLPVEVLSPEEEGALALLAARRSLLLEAAPLAVVDVGGGSAQLARERDGGPPAIASYAVGSVLLTEKFLGGAPSAEAWEITRGYVQGELAAITPAAGDVAITGGTATTVATLKLALAEYDAARVHGYVVATGPIAALAERIYFMPVRERKRLVGMPAGRADVFPGGALVIAEVLAKLGAKSAVVSAQGVRFGVAYRYFDDEKR
jgi:exopolyphosphatase/guanosine-5'-triphosphate,3'-diphosphate pyrophosphatase